MGGWGLTGLGASEEPWVSWLPPWTLRACRRQSGWLPQALKTSLLHFCEIRTSLRGVSYPLNKGHQREARKRQILYITNKRIFYLAEQAEVV